MWLLFKKQRETNWNNTLKLLYLYHLVFWSDCWYRCTCTVFARVGRVEVPRPTQKIGPTKLLYWRTVSWVRVHAVYSAPCCSCCVCRWWWWWHWQMVWPECRYECWLYVHLWICLSGLNGNSHAHIYEWASVYVGRLCGQHALLTQITQTIRASVCVACPLLLAQLRIMNSHAPYLELCVCWALHLSELLRFNFACDAIILV